MREAQRGEPNPGRLILVWSSRYQPSRPPMDGLAYQRMPMHQWPCRSRRWPITRHHVQVPSWSSTSASVSSGMVEPGTASAGIARSSTGSRDGSEAITQPGCPLAGHQDLLVVDIFRNCFRSPAAWRAASRPYSDARA